MSMFITCVPTGVSLGCQRFPSLHSAPRMKAWRCELTALSHSYNLYFVACNDAIHVYQPRFPDQAISSEPDLILHPPISSPDLDHCIDDEDPHSITRILVDYLGHDEILLVTCDDGDVVGYRIDAIQKAWDDRRHASVDKAVHIYNNDVRLFLHRNVGNSAWGLAVHREARMIAISANTFEVTVLACALTTSGSASPDSDSSESFATAANGEGISDFPSPRERDHVLTLKANNNIPSVSFNNNADDLKGRWLFASCIDGKTMLWDLHRPQAPVRVFEMGWCENVSRADLAPEAETGGCTCFNARNLPHGAWGAIFLDPDSAHETYYPDSLDLVRQDRAPYFADATQQKRRFFLRPPIDFHELSHGHGHESNGIVWDSGSEMEISENESSSSNVTDVQTSDHDDPGSNTTLSQEIESLGSFHWAYHTSNEQDDEEPGSHLMNIAALDPENLTVNTLPTGGPTAVNPFTVPVSADSDMPENDMPDEDDMYFPPELSVGLMYFHAKPRTLGPGSGPKPYSKTTSTRPYRTNTCFPALIITMEDIYLIQHPLSPTPHNHPIYTLSHPLNATALWPAFIGSHDRLCLHAHIRELGIFVVASPAGRAAIFSLTRYRAPSRQREWEWEYSVFMEFLLPFAGAE
ncbi:hypothetical protein GQ44DRAFT_763811, partial [Phaeosphaeriaceae sp. PMI808]